MAHLLVVDDEQSICWAFTKLAEKMGHGVATAASAEDGLCAAKENRPDVIVLDVRLPGMDGLAAMEHFQSAVGPVPIIVMTAYGQLETAVDAVRKGAFEYLVKPFDLKVAQRAIERALQSSDASKRDEDESPGEEMTGPIVGTSPEIQEVFKRIALVAPSDACVHLVGDSGTGKELVARAIHDYSRRSEGPFLPFNIAAISPMLAESELFGHVRGAFTGADQSRKGILELADGGTIFLDEIADIPMSLQVKLLRALECGEIWPVGGDQPIESDFRIISATHQNLRQRVAENSFRHDLYFRLITFEIEIPRLADRRTDIGELTEHFINILADKIPGTRPRLSPEVTSELLQRPWHGNVRELRNVIEYAMLLARGGLITPEHLPPPAPPPSASSTTGEEAITALVSQWAQSQLQDPGEAEDLYNRLLKLVEPPLLEAALQKHHGQYAAAARSLGLHRTTLRKKLDQWTTERSKDEGGNLKDQDDSAG